MHKLLATLGLFAALFLGCNRGPATNRASIAPPQDAWFQENVVKQSMPVIVDFNAAWCGPCQELKPHFEKLGEQHSDKLKTVSINVDERGELASHYQVNGIPQLLIFKNGRVVADETGYMSYDELEHWALKSVQ
jgi:thioredoxin 1